MDVVKHRVVRAATRRSDAAPAAPSFSFALYFAAINATERFRRPRLLAALGVLVAVEAFELSYGFGVMANVVDPVDLWADAVGIGLAVAVDVLTARVLRRRPRKASTYPQER